MASPSKVPRWTPSQSPKISLPNEPIKDYTDYASTVSEDEASFNKETYFPFSTASTTNVDLRTLPLYEVPSRAYPEEVKSHVDVEVVESRGGNSRTSTEKGVFLTWKDLCVTLAAQRNGRRAILQGLTGYAEPGEVLAIMGPSGCGKSTLLDALAGRLGSNTRQVGEILINGRRQALAFGTSAYVTQDDTLMMTLTVREAVYYSAQLQLPNSMTKSEKRERAETTIREMGLQESVDTRIGGWSVKGLSGGQKRRVSICIEILTRPNLLFLDEPTSGLDSAASYHVMSRIIGLARRDGTTVVASIHQPSAEVFEMFHNLCLLSSGRTIYFGSTTAANEREKFP